MKLKRHSAMSIVILFFVIGAYFFALFANQIDLPGFTAGSESMMQKIQSASFDSAKAAANLAISLIGVMGLWLGFVKILEAGGVMYWIGKKVQPVLKKLFPEIPDGHPALSAITLNISANMLGLGNAATPLGIKAMEELQKLNKLKTTATNSMCMFLAINTSSVALLPLGVIGLRATAGAKDPAGIFIPALLATTCSTIAAVAVASWYQKKSQPEQEFIDLKIEVDSFTSQGIKSGTEEAIDKPLDHLVDQELARPRLAKYLGIGLSIITVISLVLRAGNEANLFQSFLSFWLMPILMVSILIFGLYKGVKIYDALTEGAKQAFDVAVRIIPFMVIILAAIAMFRASGGMDFIGYLLNPILGKIGIPADVIPMALVRPLSGSGAFGVLSSIIQSAPDSYSSFVASVMMGSTETTFYVLAVYFGAVGVTSMRHAVTCGLVADIVGMLASGIICKFWF